MADKPDPYTEAEQFAMRTLMDVLNLTPHTDDLCDGTLAEMSGVYATLTEALNALTELRDDLANAMGELMETDLAVIDGVGGFERSRRTSIKWDTAAVRSLMRRHVIGTDVAGVGAWMHGDALGTGLQAQGGRPGHAGKTQVPGVANQGDLVEVDGQRGGHGNAMINR